MEDPARTAGARIPVRQEMQRIELHAVLSESIETLRATAEAKGVCLQAELDPLLDRSPGISVSLAAGFLEPDP